MLCVEKVLRFLNGLLINFEDQLINFVSHHAG